MPLDSSRSPSKPSSGALCSQTQQSCLVSHLLWGKDTAPSQGPSSFYNPIFFTSPSALPPPGLRTCHLTSGMERRPLLSAHSDLKLLFLPGPSPSPTGRRMSPWQLITLVYSSPSLATVSLGRVYKGIQENPLKAYLITQTRTPVARIQGKRNMCHHEALSREREESHWRQAKKAA